MTKICEVNNKKPFTPTMSRLNHHPLNYQTVMLEISG